MHATIERLDVRVSVVYGSVATLWIIFSDTLVGWLFATDRFMPMTVSTLKGLGFVGITTLALFVILSTELRKRTQVEQALHRTLAERQQAETALLEERNMLRTLIDTVPDRIFVKDSQSHFLINNAAHLATLGVMTQDAAVRKTDFDFFPAQEAERFFADEQQVIQTGQPLIHREEAATDHPTGRSIWLDTIKTPLRDHSGQVIGLVGISRDITERRQIDAALRESNDRFETLFRYSPYAIFLMDFATLKIVDCNEAACQMNGYAREELIGQHIDMLNVTANSEEVSRQHKERLRREGLLHFQQEHWRKDGRKITIDNYVCYFSIAGRELVVGIDQDITNQKLAEEALHESEARYRHLFQESPVALLEEDFAAVKGYLDGLRASGVSDLDSYLNDHPEALADCASLINIINVNQAALDLFGAPSAEALYGGLDRLAVAESFSILQRELVALAGLQRSFESEIVGQTLKGQPLVTLIKLNILHGYEDTWARVLVSITDITERKRLEEERVIAERLQVELDKEKELSDLKDRFISMVSHEYRTPLAVILSAHDLLRNYASRLSSDRKLKLLDDIRIQVRYMSALLDDVLTISKAQTGKLTFSPVHVDVESYCQRVFETVQLADNGAHRFTLIKAMGPVGSAELDEHLLQQILTNLLSNAAKYSPEGTEIRLEIWRKASYLVFQVSDQGIGIPAADQARLFEPFHRAQNVGHTQGTGLGLTVVKHNVEALGGTITFTSEPGVGTTFTVHLPASADDVNHPSLSSG